MILKTLSWTPVYCQQSPLPATPIKNHITTPAATFAYNTDDLVVVLSAASVAQNYILVLSLAASTAGTKDSDVFSFPSILEKAVISVANPEGQVNSKICRMDSLIATFLFLYKLLYNSLTVGEYLIVLSNTP